MDKPDTFLANFTQNYLSDSNVTFRHPFIRLKLAASQIYPNKVINEILKIYNEYCEVGNMEVSRIETPMAEGNISEMVNQLLKDEVPPRCIESNTNRDYESCDDISSSSELPRSRRPRIYGKRAIKTKKRIRKRLIKISEMSENPSEYSDISSVNPISEDSDHWPTIKSYDLPLSECNPNLYVDKEQHYKTAYLNEVEKNERLSLQIEELQQNRSLNDQMFENIHSQISLIPEEFK